MKVFRYLVACFVGVALLATAPMGRAQTDAATAEALMRDSGLWLQLDAVAAQAGAGWQEAMAGSGAQPSPTELERVSKLVSQAYSGDRLRSSAATVLVAEVQAVHVPALRRWYASPVGTAIVALEVAAAAEQADPLVLMQQGMALLSEMPAERREMIGELVRVTRVAEGLVQITVDTAMAAAQGVRSVMPDAPGVPLAEIRAGLEAQRPQLLQAYTGVALASYARAYVRLPTADLAQYLAFLASEPGRHFTDVGLKALGRAMVDASEDLGRRLQGTKDSANT